MSGIALLASRIARGWVATYTTGLAPALRDSRRAEIASDVWEHHRDAEEARRSAWGFAASVLSRAARGAPADLLWRANVEGPKMNINIPFQRIVGGLFLAMIVLTMVTIGISGYDTSREGFGDELVRLANLSTAADNANAFFRVFTSLALIAGAGLLFANLKDRSPILAPVAAFGIAAAGLLGLVAGALQLVFVELAEEYVTSSGAHQQEVLVTARGFAIAVENTTGAAFFALVLSTYVLAILAGREALVPRWLIGIPVLSAILTGIALITRASGSDDGNWILLMGGMLSSVLWLLIAGLWLLLTPGERHASLRTGHAQAT